MVDFQVVPEALRDNVRKIYDIADSWSGAKDLATGQYMAARDLGFLGEHENVPSTYNDAVDTIIEKLTLGFEALNNAGDALGDVADDYESRDAEFYQEFGYINESLDER
ncbi:hypothetical protein [Actinoalloteichus sp. GBA129-24]|uniref:hypothetical protein n=1 Tax=Actinoalloteichus sp. GBA129-24 TaxID=1612551 RepID=UPI000950B727|nr:hypothetical protein [Actinoalloteichus sp. GBA129-24]APU22101.1 hypothetical protein UA75_20560 [Actinoalloteichus sp. GBA129-24]